MTKEIHDLLTKIKGNNIFKENDFFFVGGTALSYHLGHRISYDIDIASTSKLPVGKIKAFVRSLGGRAIADKNAAQYKINTGESIDNYHMKFMIDGVKLEFSFFKHDIQMDIIENAKNELLDDESTLRILSLKDIVMLKIFALFNRQKTRDLFDAAIILENKLITYKELEDLYSFIKHDNDSIRDYLDAFNSSDDDGDNSLDFLKDQEHYKDFAKKDQSGRFQLAKEMLLEQYDTMQKNTLALMYKTIVKRAKG